MAMTPLVAAAAPRTGKPTFDVILSDCALKSFVFSTRIE